MKRFVKKVFISVLIIGTVVLLLILIPYLSLRKNPYSIPIHKTVLVLGDSRPECAINDEVLTHWHNISKSGRNYLHSWSVLRKVLSCNTHIDTVLVAIDYSAFEENRMLLTDVGNHDVYYFPLLDREEINDLGMDFNDIITSLALLPRKCLLKSFQSNLYGTSIFGSFLDLDRSKLKEDISRTIQMGKRENVYKKVAIKYLKKMEELCREKSITFVLFFPPIYQMDEYRIDYANIQKFTRENIEKVYVADYSNYTLLDSCYGDIDHLNRLGADIFSKYIKETGLKIQ